MSEVLASALLCYALRIPRAPSPEAAVDVALSTLRALAARGVVPPQVACHHALPATMCLAPA